VREVEIEVVFAALFGQTRFSMSAVFKAKLLWLYAQIPAENGPQRAASGNIMIAVRLEIKARSSLPLVLGKK